MPDNKKEQERTELHRITWNIANDLHGSVDGWDFKQYVLGMLFYRYISENITVYDLIDNNYIDCVVQLPDNLFYGTSIATCIMVLKRSKSENATLFIDASSECIKVTNSNKLTVDNIDKIVAAYTEQTDKEYFAKLVPNGKIAEQDYNLSVSTYVGQEDKRARVNITALNAEIERIVAREEVLRRDIAEIITEIEGDVVL
jgi:type I restriction enzyme M protein